MLQARPALRYAGRVEERPPEPRRGAWFVVGACFVCLVGEAIGTYVFTPMLKPIVGDFGWTRTQFTLSGLWVSLAMMLAVPAAGMLTDRGWGMAVLAFGSLCLGAAMYLFALMQSLGHFYAITILMGLGVGCVGGVPATALVSRWFAARRGLALGIMGLGHSVGGLLLPPSVTRIVLHEGWRASFQYLAWFVWLIILPVILLLVREAPAQPAGEATDPAVPGERIRLWDGLRSRTFALLAAAMFLHIAYFSAVTVHFLAFATDVGFRAERAAQAFGALLGLGILGRLFFGWAADRFARKTVMVLALLLTGVAALLLQRITTPGVLPAFVALQGLSVVGVQTLFGLLAGECFGARNLGTFLGAAMLFQVPGGVLGAIIAAVSFDRLGSYGPAFWLFTVGNLAAAAAIACVQPYAPRAGVRATPTGPESRSPASRPRSLS